MKLAQGLLIPPPPILNGSAKEKKEKREVEVEGILYTVSTRFVIAASNASKWFDSAASAWGSRLSEPPLLAVFVVEEEDGVDEGLW